MVVSGLVLMLALVLAAPPALAGEAMTIDAGYGDRYVAGRPAPVRVGITADRLLAGTLEVGTTGSIPVSIPVEVPGGSAKQYVVVVPTTPWSPSTEVTARLLLGGDTSSASVVVNAVANEELVGVLAGATGGRRLPEVVALDMDAGTARLHALGEAELDQAPAILSSLGTIVATAGDLAGLSERAREGVLRWLQDGGHLVVGADPGASVAGLPEAWQPGDARRVGAGRGQVRLAGDAVAAGAWGQMLEPTARGAPNQDRVAAGPVELSFGLASEAGVRVVELSWLLAFLVAYIVVVGPLLYVVLRRRRRPELAWVAIPLVALIFAAGAYVGGRGLRADTELVHASVLDTGEVGSTLTSYVGVATRRGETVRLSFPRNWIPLSNERGENFGSGGPVLVSTFAATTDSTVAAVPLDVGQFAVMGASGPVAGTGRLEVSGSLGADGLVSGTVRNATGTTVRAVGILLGQAGVKVGDLTPGEAREFTLEPTTNAFDGGPPVEWRLWGNEGRPFVDRDRLVDLSLWGATDATRSQLADGRLLAAGWTRDFEPPVASDSRASEPQGTTLVLGRGVLGTGIGVSGTVGHVEALRTGQGGGEPEVLLRLDVPPSVPSERIHLRSPVPAVEVWSGSSWVQLRCDGCPERAVQAGFPVMPALPSRPSEADPGRSSLEGIDPPVRAPDAPPFVGTLPPRPDFIPGAGECPPGAACGFAGFEGRAFLLPLPSEAILDGSVFVRSTSFAPTSIFRIEVVEP